MHKPIKRTVRVAAHVAPVTATFTVTAAEGGLVKTMAAKLENALSTVVRAIRLEYRQGSSDKVYEIDIMQIRPILSAVDNVYAVKFRYGRRGSTLQSGVKMAEGDINQATACAVNLAVSKEAKGYTRVSDVLTPVKPEGVSAPAKLSPCGLGYHHLAYIKKDNGSHVVHCTVCMHVQISLFKPGDLGAGAGTDGRALHGRKGPVLRHSRRAWTDENGKGDWQHTRETADGTRPLPKKATLLLVPRGDTDYVVAHDSRTCEHHVELLNAPGHDYIYCKRCYTGVTVPAANAAKEPGIRAWVTPENVIRWAYSSEDYAGKATQVGLLSRVMPTNAWRYDSLQGAPKSITTLTPEVAAQVLKGAASKIDEKCDHTFALFKHGVMCHTCNGLWELPHTDKDQQTHQLFVTGRYRKCTVKGGLVFFSAIGFTSIGTTKIKGAATWSLKSATFFAKHGDKMLGSTDVKISFDEAYAKIHQIIDDYWDDQEGGLFSGGRAMIKRKRRTS